MAWRVGAVCLAFALVGTLNVSAFTAPYSNNIFKASPVVPISLSRANNNNKLCRSEATQLHGIPKMFRWLTDQYPNINRRLSEGLTTSRKVDNFYLDMNGIIHPCTHGNSDDFVELNETEMFKKIFLYVDRLYKLVKPTRVLYLAVDGVAPRAKMNQQRSRRFRSSKEAEELMASIVARDGKLPEGEKFDSNCITPGTDFMLKLSLAMNKWIEYKIATDPFWKDGATVIFSGPDVPGEGEHKVMDYIRWASEGGDPTYHEDGPLQHVLYGLDADLIMLGLVTHEPKFMLLREKMSVVMAGRGKGRNRNRKPKSMMEYGREDFELLELSILREMFDLQFKKMGKKDVGFDIDVDRVIDDFIFYCMLVGNDFLPHSPHLSIDSGALSLMLNTYTDLLPKMGGYLTKREMIHPERFQLFMDQLMKFERSYFESRAVEEGENGWASDKYDEFYYAKKLELDPSDSEITEKRRAIAKDYMEGLHWVLNYYHNGCKSWDWFFPHLYSPISTDLYDVKEFYGDCDDEGFAAFNFELGTPFPSLAQLLSVLPPQSAKLLPKSYAKLMLEEDSPLSEYYPPDFTTDANGKRQPWEAVVKIPFISSSDLMGVVNGIDEDELSKAEKRRNAPGKDSVFVPAAKV